MLHTFVNCAKAVFQALAMEQLCLLQLSRFKLQVLRRYNVKFYKMRKFTLETP
jgi:hypothetical protein